MSIQILLKNIYATGMTDAAIGKVINAPQPTVTRLRNGVHKNTSYERVKAIEALYRERCRSQGDIPA